MLNYGKMVVVVCALVAAGNSAQGQLEWINIMTENFNADPSGQWSYSGVQDGGSQDMIRWNSAGYVDAQWDQSNFMGYGDPYVIQSSRYSRALGQSLTDTQTFKFSAKITIQSVASTTEFFQVANFGLYNLAHMGEDRGMSDNYSGNSTLVKDGSDFVEWNYFIQNESFGWNPNTSGIIGAHITGVDGDYTFGSIGDPYYHNTDMGAGNYLPVGTDLYVEVTYFGGAAGGDRRRAYSAVYTDEARTNLLSGNGVEQYYWTQPLDEGKSFSLTDAAFYNYPSSNWGGPNGTGVGTYDDFYVAVGVLPGDANDDGVVSADDYGSVQLNFGNTGAPGLPGDANGDGVVSGDDYASVQDNFGDTAGMGSVPVPEPATMGLLACGLTGLLARPRKQ